MALAPTSSLLLNPYSCRCRLSPLKSLLRRRRSYHRPLLSAVAMVMPEEIRWPGWLGDNVFRVIVPVLNVGGIIGHKGELIKKLCEEKHAWVLVLDSSSPPVLFLNCRLPCSCRCSNGGVRVHVPPLTLHQGGRSDGNGDSGDGGGSRVEVEGAALTALTSSMATAAGTVRMHASLSTLLNHYYHEHRQ